MKKPKTVAVVNGDRADFDSVSRNWYFLDKHHLFRQRWLECDRCGFRVSGPDHWGFGKVEEGTHWLLLLAALDLSCSLMDCLRLSGREPYTFGVAPSKKGGR